MRRQTPGTVASQAARCFARTAVADGLTRSTWMISNLNMKRALIPLAYVGGVIDIHKTMNLQGQLPRVLEIIAPAQGIYEGDWALKWLAAHAEVGCAWSQGHPTMPAPNHLGEPTVRALGSDECGAWLRALADEAGHENIALSEGNVLELLALPWSEECRYLCEGCPCSPVKVASRCHQRDQYGRLHSGCQPCYAIKDSIPLACMPIAYFMDTGSLVFNTAFKYIGGPKFGTGPKRGDHRRETWPLASFDCPMCGASFPVGLHMCHSCTKPIHYPDGMFYADPVNPFQVEYYGSHAEWLNDLIERNKLTEFQLHEFPAIKQLRNFPVSRSLAEDHRQTAFFGVPPIKCTAADTSPKEVELFKRSVRGTIQGAIRLDISIERLVAGITGKEARCGVEDFFNSQSIACAATIVKHFGAVFATCREKPLCYYARWSIHCQRAYRVCLSRGYLSPFYTGVTVDYTVDQEMAEKIRLAHLPLQNANLAMRRHIRLSTEFGTLDEFRATITDTQKYQRYMRVDSESLSALLAKVTLTTCYGIPTKGEPGYISDDEAEEIEGAAAASEKPKGKSKGEDESNGNTALLDAAETPEETRKEFKEFVRDHSIKIKECFDDDRATEKTFFNLVEGVKDQLPDANSTDPLLMKRAEDVFEALPDELDDPPRVFDVAARQARRRDPAPQRRVQVTEQRQAPIPEAHAVPIPTDDEDEDDTELDRAVRPDPTSQRTGREHLGGVAPETTPPPPHNMPPPSSLPTRKSHRQTGYSAAHPDGEPLMVSGRAEYSDRMRLPSVLRMKTRVPESDLDNPTKKAAAVIIAMGANPDDDINMRAAGVTVPHTGNTGTGRAASPGSTSAATQERINPQFPAPSVRTASNPPSKLPRDEKWAPSIARPAPAQVIKSAEARTQQRAAEETNVAPPAPSDTASSEPRSRTMGPAKETTAKGKSRTGSNVTGLIDEADDTRTWLWEKAPCAAMDGGYFSSVAASHNDPSTIRWPLLEMGQEPHSLEEECQPSEFALSEPIDREPEDSWDVCSVPSGDLVTNLAKETPSSSLGPKGEPAPATTPQQRALALGASLLSLGDPVPSFAWESGFWESFFDDKPAVDRMVPALKFHRPSFAGSIEEPTPPQAEVQASAKRPRKEGPSSFLEVVKNRSVISWRDKREAEHRRALCKWSCIFDKLDSESDPVIKTIASLPETEKLNTLDDYMARKAPSTLTKRANSILKIIKVGEAKGLRFPVSEPQLYELLQEAKTGGALPSQLRGVMEGLLFARHVFDIAAFSQIAISRRCWGVGASRIAKTPSKAAPLRVIDLVALHQVLDSRSNPWDRLFAGCALFCVYSRSRWSDAQHVDSFNFDKGPDSLKVYYLEAVIDIHKNMNRRGRSPVPLELVAPGLGVSSEGWIEKFLDARTALGLSAEHAFMPAPDASGVPTIRALDSDECGEWLLRLLPDRQGLKTTSHSLKRTMLSYCAKWGISHDDRLAMGGHSHPGRMSDEYADDAMARPLRLIEMVIKAIRTGRFHPDSTRAGRFEGGEPTSDPAAPLQEEPERVPPASLAAHEAQTSEIDRMLEHSSSDEHSLGAAPSLPGTENKPLPKQSLVEDERPVAEEAGSGLPTDSSSSDSSSANSSASAPEPSVRPVRLLPPPVPADGCRFVQHARFKTLHLQRLRHVNMTLCGRLVKSPIGEPGILRYDTPVCRACKKVEAMALVDSHASFRSRCVEMCGGDEMYRKLAGKEIKSFSDLAFACGTPQAPPSVDEFRAFSEEILGLGARLGETSKLTRLHFEAATYVIAQLKQQVVGDTTDEPKRLPLAEKEARYREQRLRLSGLVIQGELLPSHALVDAVAHMSETNCLTWLSPSKCTKRDQELKIGPKEKSRILTVLDNSVTVTAQPDKLIADHSTPLQLQWCLQRRGLAFDMNRIISWETHEKWVCYLLQCLTSDSIPGYSHVTVAQVVKADSEMFLLMSKEIKNVKASATGEMEADTLLDRLRTDPRITMHLLPLPKALSSLATDAVVDGSLDGDKNPRKKPRRERRTSALTAAVKVDNMPKELKDCKFYTDQSGRRLCWTHNTGTCNAATDGGHPPACKRGVHAGKAEEKDPGRLTGRPTKNRTETPCYDPPHFFGYREPQDQILLSSEVREEPALQHRDSSECSAQTFAADPAHDHFEMSCLKFFFTPHHVSDHGQHPAEEFARNCLQQGSGDSSSWMELAELLPDEESSRETAQDPLEKCFITGAYNQGGITGVRRNCRQFPACTRLLVTLARIAFPGLTFTSVGFFRNMQTALHKDANNLPGSRNGICALSFFEGGQLRLHRADGPVNLSLSEGPLQFDPFLEHETLPWSNGSRIVLVAFSVNCLERLTPEHRAVLAAFDFLLPLSKDQSEVASQVSQADSRPASQLPQTDEEAGMFLELFAGTARLSQAFTRLGFQALAFDKVCRSSHPVQALDFADRSECEVVLQLIQDHASSLQYVHMAPPQETCLAARNKESATNPAPPARSAAQPLGLEGLPESLQRQVTEANDLYMFSHDVFMLCRKFNIVVSVEAPASSLFWLLPMIQDLLSCADNQVVDFHECMHGGDRDRKLRWLCSAPWFKPLGLSCNRMHPHAPWNAASDTGAKGAYPHLLCARIAELVASQVCSLPAAPSLFGPASSVTRLAYEKQPRKHRALVSEFGAYDAWAVPLGFTACPPALLKAYPKGARAVRRKLLHWGQIRACVLPSLDFALLESNLGSNWKWSMDSHAPPLEEEDQPICKVCGFMSDSTFEDLCEVLWIGIPRSPSDFVQQAVLAGHPKRILEAQIDERTKLLVDNLLTGRAACEDLGKSRLAEWNEIAKELEPVEEQARKSLDPLVSKIIDGKKTFLLERNAATLARVSSQPVDAVAEKAWSETLEEQQKGWLFEDPAPDLSSVLVARRFGIIQGAKTRVIDDGKAAGINQTVGLPERFRLHSIDFISAFLVWAMMDPRAKGKQVKPKFFGAAALPFGTTGSVAGFLRTSAATWHIGSALLGLSWCNYFDDFPLFSLDEHCLCAESCAEALLDILGITFAKEGKKATEFSKQCRALGLIIDLSEFGNGVVYIKHTPERIQELRQTLTRILDSGLLESSEAEALRGRLHWFSSFLFGRRPCQALRVLGLRAKGLDRGRKLSSDLRDALTYLRDRALESPPVQLTPDIKETFYVFTDGSLEGEVAGVGGILYDPLGKPLSFFAASLPLDALNRLKETSSHPIYEIELLAIWAALKLWMNRLTRCLVVVYLDNEAAKGALVSGKSSTLPGQSIVSSVLDLEDSARIRPWYGRVPTSSNPADEPSRSVFGHLLREGVQRLQAPCAWPV
ncbi:unnamed protein product [Symbiodinium sp. CCMP2592]|nr:unnamed protein product [Symbiodinium sp. CCMP2592]